MSVLGLISWGSLLGLLAALAITPLRRGQWFPQLLATGFVLLLVARSIDLGAGPSALEAWRIHIGAGDAPVTLGTDPAADVVLHDRHGAPIHAQVDFTDSGPTIHSLTATKRLERNGVDIHHPALTEGTVIELDGHRWTVTRIDQGLPGVVIEDDEGVQRRLKPPLIKRLAAALPWIGDRMELPVAQVIHVAEGDGSLTPYLLARQDDALRPVGPVAEIALRDGVPLLRFPTPGDRHAHRVRVQPPGAEPFRPADQPARLHAGDELTIGYTTYTVAVGMSGSLDLEVTGTAPRRPFEPRSGILAVGPGGDLSWPTGAQIVLQTARDDGDVLLLTSTDPTWSLADRQGYVWLHRSPTPLRASGPIPLAQGSGLIISGDRHEEILRFRAATAPLQRLAGAEPGTPESRLVRALALTAALYVALTLLLTLRGYLNERNAAVFHAAALLLGLGLAVLTDLSPPGDPRTANIAVRQATLAALGLSIGAALAAVDVVLALVRPRHHRPASLMEFLERPLLPGRLNGPLGAVSRVWLLWVCAAGVLALQLPFGEQGIRAPWLGSLQPVEAAKTLTLTFVAFLSVRAIEDKRYRLKNAEGLLGRWTYMLHALPILAVAALCFGLDDISPILVFALFLWAMYLLTLLRPSRKFWPPSAWLENVYLEQFLLLGLVVATVWMAIRLEDGTVAERFRVWLDPWHHTAASGQFIASLWTVLDGGLTGRGFGAALAHPPPAAQDDFVLAVFANRTGLVGVGLLLLTYAALVAGGLWAAAGVRPDRLRRGSHDRARMLAVAALLMLTIQVTIVFASVTGIAPIMGQPLPFVAAGGSHLLMFCLPAVALVLLATRNPRSALLRGPGEAGR